MRTNIVSRAREKQQTRARGILAADTPLGLALHGEHELYPCSDDAACRFVYCWGCRKIVSNHTYIHAIRRYHE